MEKKRIKKMSKEESFKKAKSSKNEKVLKRKLKTSVANISKDIDVISEKTEKGSSFNFSSFMNDFAQALVIASIIILLAISFIIIGSHGRIENGKVNSSREYFDDLEEVKVVKKSGGFFGALTTSYEYTRDASVGVGSGGASNETAGLNFGEKNLSGVSSDLMIMPPMEMFKYNYEYAGDDFDLFPEEVSVYKRVNPDLSREFANNFSDKKISFFDMKRFKNISVTNISINEDVDYGYSLYLGLKDGGFSLYKNWEKWPNIEKLCRGYDYSCYEQNRFKIKDVLDDPTIISIADRFLNEYGIPLSNYGPGDVQNYWIQEYLLSSEKESFYVPDVVSVIYPLKIEGRDVYEEYGQKFGLTVEVDMREKRVSSIFNLFYQYYESSSYSTERSKDAILDMLGRGGAYADYGYYREGYPAKSVDIKVDTPSLEMVKIWHYDNERMAGSEIYLPAYVFPVISDSSQAYFYRKNIVIPAVKDFFNINNYIVPFSVSEKSSPVSSGGAGSVDMVILEKDVTFDLYKD